MPNPLDPGSYASEELRGFGFKAVGENVRISRAANVVGPENIEIGDHVRIDPFTSLVAVDGFLRLGSYIHIAANCLLSCRGGVVMEDFTGLSQGGKIYSANDDYSGRFMTGPLVPASHTRRHVAPVHFGRHVVVGSSSVVLPGVTLGEGSAVGALSLVPNSIPAWEIHAGIPARKRGERSRQLLAREAELRAALEVEWLGPRYRLVGRDK